MLAWMLYVVMVTLLLSIGALSAERAARLRRARTRGIWITAIVASLAIPTVIASVSVELPGIMAPAVAQKVVALREVTTQALSPVMWISGSAGEPRGWRDSDSLLTTVWRAASGAMLLGLIASGVHVFVRKRRWRSDTIAGAAVYVTPDVGPAVVGLLRPRIAIPQWVTQALPQHQSAVIAHEQAHLDASDPQLFTFALALLVFMPWNLPLWWQLRRLRYAIEVDCDARVVASGLDAVRYGETLITVGERQSAYVGAVAAMSESRSFLEERIRIMLSQPIKWRRAGVAALAAISLALTALAAQVSPPNVRAVEAAPQGGAPASAARTAIKLPATTLDRYAGAYRLSDRWYVEVRREGDAMKARITGQPELEIFPESETTFFWKPVDATITFATDGTGGATLHQWGKDMPLTRVPPAESAQAQAALDARIVAQTPQPGTEAALRHLLESAQRGQVDYDSMDPMLSGLMKPNDAAFLQLIQQLGPVKSMTFKSVGRQGWDAYEVQFANGALNYYITLASDGKIEGLMGISAP